MDQVQFSTADVVREIDNVLAQLNDLASSDVSTGDFYQQFLLQVSSLLDGAAAAVWWIGPRGSIHLAHHLGIEEIFGDRASHQREALRLAESRTASAEQLQTAIGERTALSVPLTSSEHSAELQRRGVLVAYQDERLSSSVTDGQLRFLTAVAEIAVEFEFQSRRRQQAGSAANSKALEHYLLSIHRQGSLQEIAHRIASDGRVLLGCDRMSVLMLKGRKQCLLACGGANAPERRSRLVRSMEQLATDVCRAGETLVIPSDRELLAPQIERPLQTFLEESATRSLVVVPLTPDEKPDGNPFGAIVVESFALDEGAERLREIETATSHATLALERGKTVATFPTNFILGATKPIRWAFDRRLVPAWLLGLLLFSILAFCLTMIPIPFRVTVPGVLRPSNRTYVFANQDGFVDKLSVRHGSVVRRGDMLMSLTSPDLELEIKRVLGDLETQRQQMKSNAAERLQLDPVDRRAEQKASELSSRAMTVAEKIRSLEVQFQLLTNERKRLVHASPIDGTVLDWELEEKLQQRRIRRGQRVMEVAELEGPWHLELAIPDHRAGHVLKALGDSNSLDVSFVLENEASNTISGTTQKIASTTQTVNGVPSVLVEVTFNREDVSDLRPNATAIAKIECGHRSAAFVWLHEFYEELRRRLF